MKTMDGEWIRIAILQKFIDKNKSYYKNNIARKNADGTYEWYLWNCLMNPTIVTYEWIVDTLSRASEVFIFWDVNNKSKFRFDREKYELLRICHDLNDVLCMKWSEFSKVTQELPDDIYIVDGGLINLYAITHEYIDGKRYCLLSNAREGAEK